MRTEDGYIIHKCLNGDSAAFGLLVDKYKASIYGLAYSKLGNFHDAEDITQEVFIKAYQNLRKLRRWDSFLAWLYSITSNLCKNFARAQSRRPDHEFIADKDPEALEVDSMNSYSAGLAYESLREVLDSLPKMYHQALTLHYLSGMSSVEIARFLGTSANTIRQRLYRARSQLKEEMVAMMNTTFDDQRLPATFTFRILEVVKRMKINPIPRMPALPWGLSLATSIIIAILSLNPSMSMFDPMDISTGSPLPVKARILKIGEIPVDVLEVSQMLALAGKQEDSENRHARPPGLGAPPPDSGVAIEDDPASSEPGAIKGKVTDIAHPTKNNLAGAVIIVRNDELLVAEGGKRTITTGSNGEYLIDNLTPGKYILTVSQPGYEPIEQRIRVSPRATVFHDFRMFLKGTEVGPPQYVDNIRRQRAKPKLKSPQEPEKPYPYRVEEIVYQSKKADIQIAGTFIFPNSNGSFPAVILLSDYLPHDRDELRQIHVAHGILEHRPFLVLADYLTRQGIAVLRTDDRGKGGSTGDLFESTFEELADDALAGIEYLKSREEVNAGQIGVIGHGIGGFVALATADRSEDIAFVVLMGGVGLSGEELLLSSGALIWKSIGESDREIAKQSETYRRIFAVLKQEEDNEIAMQKIRDAIVDVTVEFSETKLSEAEIQAIRTSSGSEHFNNLNPYFRSFLTFDPGQLLMKLKCPIFAFNNENNPSIPPEQNLDAIEEALKAGGNERYTIKALPGLNYGFQTAQPGVPPDKIEETISPVVLKLIGDWLIEQIKGAQR